jgi:hypothetical protein
MIVAWAQVEILLLSQEGDLSP